MDTLFKIILGIHITGGTLGLLAGSYIMIAKKGDKTHKQIGRLFAVSMLGAGLCSFALAVLHPNYFLFAVGIFTVYLTSTGWRYLSLRKIPEGQKAQTIDWLLLVFMVLGSLWFVRMGIGALLNKEYFGILILIFAWRGFALVYQDYTTFNGQIKEKNYWLLNHLSRMGGAYIASMTAFAVVNAPDRLSFLPWLLPSVLFVPLLIRWSKKYKGKAAVTANEI